MLLFLVNIAFHPRLPSAPPNPPLSPFRRASRAAQGKSPHAFAFSISLPVPITEHATLGMEHVFPLSPFRRASRAAQVHTLLPSPFPLPAPLTERGGLGTEHLFRLTPLLATHPKNAPLSPIIATLTKSLDL